VCFSPDGQRILSGNSDGTLTVRDLGQSRARRGAE
jgi:hypothetical protein